MAIALRGARDIEALRKSNQIVAQTLSYLKSSVKSGMTLLEVNQLGEDFIYSKSARPAFKGLYNFPCGVCTSVNETIIHGVPSNYVLKDGDILGLDIGVELNGWYGDSAITIPIGLISDENQRLIDCAKDTLEYAIEIIDTDMRLKELSFKIEQYIINKGYYPLIGYCGHGIGRKPHEEPEIPNYLEHGKANTGPKIKNGMVFCIEPMICQKSGIPRVLEDKWSVVSEDGLNGSHYEHTVAIINNRAEILSQE
jgi:methionyl aminopeptidase